MDLWIRSQDREIICKAECVDLMHDTEGYAKVFLNGKFPDLIVGAYENKRALEIINEIEATLKIFGNSRKIFVYEMPKE